LQASWWISELPPEPVRSLVQDDLMWYGRLIGLAVGFLLLLVNYHVSEEGERSEFISLILFSTAGILLVANANDLMLLFLALELVSIPTYILIGLSRKSLLAQEATGKYFFLGAFAAALNLYGFSFLYGATGTAQLFGSASGRDCIYLILSRPGGLNDPLVMVGLLLSLAGLTFKIAAVPFYFYVADVYQGAASPVAGLLGFVPKFAGFIAIIRLLSLCGWAYGGAVFWLLWVLAAATMFVGNTLALMQDNVKRMLAYSSIAHSGYMLVALVAGPGPQGGMSASPMQNGLSAALFYMVVYGVMNLGAFAVLAYFRKTESDGEDSVETLRDIAGTARRHPWACLALAICVLGLMGFPLTAGFLGKVYVFSAGLSSGAGPAAQYAMVVLVVLGVINAAIGAAYYLRILSACYLGRSTESITPSRCVALRLGIALCAIAVLALFFKPGPLIDRSRAAVAAVPVISPTMTAPTLPPGPMRRH
ncbi:MAG TPA: NADH-quinone oxidoreductase subunit N, partial [Phycisphaerae bacterium]|nr:NADH-quinone oxidoreductase subunit N [Phycisphaerae bacterium]